MQCKNHPEENGVNTCNQCGTWLCEKCSFEREGRYFCPSCASQGTLAGAGSSGTGPLGDGSGGTGSYGSGSYGSSTHRGPTGPYDRGYSGPGYVDRSVSWGLLFLFSVIIPIPGINYMYLGLIKRGLVAMSAFFGSIYLTIQFMSSGAWAIGILFIFSIPVLWLSTTFDGFKIRNRMNYGEVVTDNIDDILGFIRRNRGILTGFLLFLLAINVVPALFGFLRNIIPIIIVVWAIYILFKKPK